MAKAIEVGRKVRVAVHDLGPHGEGVGRIEERTFFVPGALPGEEIEAEVAEVKARYARGRLLRVLRSSPDRVAPTCAVADTCGGCQLQHLAYTAQLDWKRRHVEAVLQRHPENVGVAVHPTLGMRHPWRYRHKALVPIGEREGAVIAGFFARGSHQLVDLSECPVQHPVADRVVRVTKALATRHRIPVYDEATGEGVLRHVLVRVGRGSGEAMAVLVTNGPVLPAASEIAQALLAEVPGLVGVMQNVNAERTNVALGPETRVLAGEPAITDYIGDLAFRISPVSFFQVNPEQTEALYGQARTYAALSGRERVLDLYCGIGTIALFLARDAGEVVGVEDVPQAIDDARANAARNGIGNARFRCGDVAAELPRLAAEGYVPDVVVLDPPRRGCDEAVLDALAASGPDRIVYVSCNPTTLARDLAMLAHRGYRTAEVTPVDMFPHTAHVECCARLERADGPAAG